MFAVPGWNVTAPLKTQTAPPKALPTQADSEKKKSKEPKQETKDITKQSKKRKRDPKPENLSEQTSRQGDNDRPQQTTAKLLTGSKSHKRVKSNGAGETSAAQKASSSRDVPDHQEKQEQQPKKSKKNKPKLKHGTTDHDALTSTSSPPKVPLPVPATSAATQLTPLQASMRAKLAAARFRHLNETLYTSPSTTASRLFKDDPDMFADYHTGFRQQVASWPENPVESFISDILTRGAIKVHRKDEKRRKHQQHDSPGEENDPNLPNDDTKKPEIQPLPRARGGTSTIADLGCGDAHLALTLHNHHSTRLNLTILSYDLHTPSPNLAGVRAADIANLPLDSGSIDVAVFSLALMGTNWPDFIDEAWRVLRWGGECWVAEIRSRFSRSSGTTTGRKQQQQAPPTTKIKRGKTKKQSKPTEEDDEEDQASTNAHLLATHVDGVTPPPAAITDVQPFVDVLRARGFALMQEPDVRNKMFVLMRFVKSGKPVRGRNVQGGNGDGGGRDGGGQKRKLKFLDEGNGGDGEEDDGKVLKPCVYKLR